MRQRPRHLLPLRQERARPLPVRPCNPSSSGPRYRPDRVVSSGLLPVPLCPIRMIPTQRQTVRSLPEELVRPQVGNPSRIAVPMAVASKAVLVPDLPQARGARPTMAVAAAVSVASRAAALVPVDLAVAAALVAVVDVVALLPATKDRSLLLPRRRNG